MALTGFAKLRGGLEKPAKEAPSPSRLKGLLGKLKMKMKGGGCK